ncbi:hypothetical protein BCV72DRAFT_207201 [Rhizopus microsporus var. microsporus]|uniref:Ubiquitin-like domain-containing protein n=1 Tax=Rhizopus microsporus var. microsporus TaxID=86635 RepID=A0A1X0R3B1_RHIZD|nr:hypothetical protein BCV72DRAFT_207201 [Rhizopus microsporus var. microsporus]
MQIFVTTVFRSVIILNVESFESIDTIKQKINEKLNISDPDYSLSFHGRMLKNRYNLRDYDIRIGSTLQMATPLKGGSSYPNPLNNGKVRCSLELCTSAYVKIIGDCNYCQAKYCSRHRLPEDHACYNMNVCKQLAHRRNSEKLLNECCVASKVNNL